MCSLSSLVVRCNPLGHVDRPLPYKLEAQGETWTQPGSEFSDMILASNMSFLGLKETKWFDCRYLALAKPRFKPRPYDSEVFFPLQNKHKAAWVSQTLIQYSTSGEVRNHQSRFAISDRVSVKCSYFISLG